MQFLWISSIGMIYPTGKLTQSREAKTTSFPTFGLAGRWQDDV